MSIHARDLSEVIDFNGAFRKVLPMEKPVQAKELRTAEELQAMILEDLRQVDGCPKQGVNITVYGIPWNAMLMFGTTAGTVRNRDELKRFFGIITERLQRLYGIKFDDA